MFSGKFVRCGEKIKLYIKLPQIEKQKKENVRETRDEGV
jgi:hypothetical protein